MTIATRTYDLLGSWVVPHGSVLVSIEAPSEPILSVQDGSVLFVDRPVGTHDFWVHLVVPVSNFDHQPFDALTWFVMFVNGTCIIICCVVAIILFGLELWFSVDSVTRFGGKFLQFEAA